MYKCSFAHPDCVFETEKLQGLRRHLTMTHKGYTDDEIAAIVRAATAEEGAAPTGARNFAEAAQQAPASDMPEELKPRRVRKPKEPEPEPLTPYQETILQRVAHLLAMLPWLIMAYLWKEPGINVSESEAESLIKGFREMFDLFGWRPASKVWAPMIVAEEEYKIGQARWPLIAPHLEPKKKGKPVPGPRPEPEPEATNQ